MHRRIEPRQYRTGTSDGHDVEKIDELETRRAKHERLTRSKPEKSFGELLDQRMKRDDEEGPEEEAQEPGARNPLLGLDPNQDAHIANKAPGRRSAKVIVKG